MVGLQQTTQPSCVSWLAALWTCCRTVIVCSCPEDLLPGVLALIRPYGIHVPAGRADDALHVVVLNKWQKKSRIVKWLMKWLMRLGLAEDYWKNVWRGKVCNAIFNARAMHAGPIIVVCITGGPQCDWERRQFYTGGDIWRGYAGDDLYMKTCTNAEDLRRFCRRGAPLQECDRLPGPQ
eukprot:CAMPEP_0179036094 /NCGR_PEP_ID=MMETSP0796-20121207/13441_1 /TAXON_ID=73915 /ORGANISM="Pyrodinium bahamense, Strain pbaha01" /LENGTH=178 /DNA_ID=CAMNT_0020732371 /DNA_START=43 /DNA_END=579 /DNA_ORIENTATION=+